MWSGISYCGTCLVVLQQHEWSGLENLAFVDSWGREREREINV